MITLLALLLMVQLFTPPQEQVTSAGGPPVEVLDVEVEMHNWKSRALLAPRRKPPGAVGAQQIPGVLPGRDETEPPTIEERSIELGRVDRRPASDPVPARSASGYIYDYKVRLKNTSSKKIKSILWEYQITDGSNGAIVSQRVFLCAATLKSGGIKQLAARTPSPPNRVVSAETPDESQKQGAVINQVEFSDGSRWVREGWKQEDSTRANAATKARDLREGQCTLL